MSRINIGGQAVMEGVMMRNNDRYAVAVRKPDKQIEVRQIGVQEPPTVRQFVICRLCEGYSVLYSRSLSV